MSQVTCRLFDKLASGEKIDQAQAKVFFESLLNELGFDHVTISDELVSKWFKLADNDKSGGLTRKEVENFVNEHLVNLL